MDFVKWLFTFNGRATRSQFWLFSLSFDSVLLVLAFLHKSYVLPPIVLLPAFWLLFVPAVAIQVKRWHDLDKCGAFVFTNLVPIIGWAYSLCMLGFARGTDGENFYGPDPLDPLPEPRPSPL